MISVCGGKVTGCKAQKNTENRHEQNKVLLSVCQEKTHEGGGAKAFCEVDQVVT